MLPIVPCVVGLILWGISWLPIVHQWWWNDGFGGLKGEFVSCPHVWLCVCVFSIHAIRHMNFHTTAAWLHNSTSSAFSSKFIKYTFYRPLDLQKIHFQTKVHVFKTNKGRHSASIVKNCRRTITCWPILSWGWVGKPAGDSVNWKTPSAEVLSSIYQLLEHQTCREWRRLSLINSASNSFPL